MLSSYKSQQSINILNQPRSFYIIFFLEMWERFGYYGAQALLAFYFVKELNMTEAQSFITFGAFSSLVYGMVSVGGYIADNLLGIKRTIILGTVVLAVGYTVLALGGSNHEQVFLGLATIACGNGLFKANPSNLLCKFYTKDQAFLLDGAFTMYYMSINLGSVFATGLTPFIAAKYGFQPAFLLSSIGLLMALFSFIGFMNWMKKAGSKPDFKPLNYKYFAYVLLGTLVAIACSTVILQHVFIANVILICIGVLVVYVFIKNIYTTEKKESKQMLVAFILMLQAILFWVLYQQLPTSLNFFAIHNVNPTLFGLFSIDPISFQLLNPFWIVVASPVLAFFYNLNGLSKKPMSMPTKFAVGMFFSAVAFLIIPLGAHFADSNGIVSANWLILAYFFQAIGELLISALGLSMVATLVPKRMHGFIMGVWFLTSSAGAIIAGYLGSFAAIPSSNDLGSNHLMSLNIYSNYFMEFGIGTLISAVIITVVNKKLDKILSGVTNNDKVSNELQSVDIQVATN